MDRWDGVELACRSRLVKVRRKKQPPLLGIPGAGVKKLAVSLFSSGQAGDALPCPAAPVVYVQI